VFGGVVRCPGVDEVAPGFVAQAPSASSCNRHRYRHRV
jgi:hypothetical protein